MLVNLGDKPDPDLSTASVVILVCPIYARSYYGAKEFSLLVENHPDIPLVGASVGASDPENPENIQAYKALIKATFSEGIQSRMQWFHLRGGLDYPRMSHAHRAMMWMVSRAAKRKGAKGDAESQMMYETYGQVIDFRDRSTIEPIVEYVRGLSSRPDPAP